MMCITNTRKRPLRRGSVIQITFSRVSPRLVSRITCGEAPMKRFCFLAVLIALSSSAHAGRSISFSVGSHRVHIESSRHCRSVSCASMSISRSLDWRRKRDRYNDDRDAAVPAKPVPSSPQTISPPAPPATTAPAKTIVTAPPPAVYTRPHREARSSLRLRHLRRPHRHRFNRFRFQRRCPRRPRNRSRPRSLRRRSSASRIRPRKSRRIRRSVIGRPKAGERCGSQNAAMRCAASCSVHRTRRAKRS